MEGEIQDENKKGHHEHGLRGGRGGDGIKNAHGGLVPIARGIRLPQRDEQRQREVRRGVSVLYQLGLLLAARSTNFTPVA